MEFQRHGFVWVGRLVEEKGVALLGRVSRSLPTPVDVLGDGPLRSTLIAQAGPNSLLMHGWVAQPSLVLSRRKVFLSTSPSEGMSYALLDALNCGCLPLLARAAFDWLGLPDACLWEGEDDLILKARWLASTSEEERFLLWAECTRRVETIHSWQALLEGLGAMLELVETS